MTFGEWKKHICFTYVGIDTYRMNKDLVFTRSEMSKAYETHFCLYVEPELITKNQ